MFEIIILVGLGAALAALARKRGKNPWLLASSMVGGYIAIRFVSALVGGFPGMGLLLGLVFGVTLYGMVWITTRRRHGGTTWQCPDCLSWNDPDALFCGCGYRLEGTDPDEDRQGEPNA